MPLAALILREGKMDNTNLVIAQGSKIYQHRVPIILSGALNWFDVASLFPDAITFEPLDSLIITNNSAQTINFYLDSPNDVYPVLAYQIQPIIKRFFRRYGIENTGLAATLATDIVIAMRRLPTDIKTTVIVR